jgi:hypothetical protein
VYIQPGPTQLQAARGRGLANSHARWDAEDDDKRPWWLFCNVEQFMWYLESVEAERREANSGRPD